MINLEKDYFSVGDGFGNHLGDKVTYENLSNYCNNVDVEIDLSGALVIKDSKLVFPNIVKIEVLWIYTPYLADIFPHLTYVGYLSIGTWKIYLGNLREVDLIYFQYHVKDHYNLKHLRANEYDLYNNNKKIHKLFIT